MNVMTSPPQPMLEGTEVTITCEADGGKPLPNVQWFLQGKHRDLLYYSFKIAKFSDCFL
jgi:hypothetical protein